jgi:hypothetical protein
MDKLEQLKRDDQDAYQQQLLQIRRALTPGDRTYGDDDVGLGRHDARLERLHPRRNRYAPLSKIDTMGGAGDWSTRGQGRGPACELAKTMK